MPNIGYLYSISNTDATFVYLGITNNTKRRFSEHKNNSHVSKICKEDKDNLVFKVLCVGNYKFIAEVEKKLIYKYREENLPIINVLDGGEYPSGLSGSKHWNSYLTEDQILLIRELYASEKYTGRELSSIFNTGYKNISKIVRGDRWLEIGGPITKIRLDISKVANRAKISPEQVPLIREEAMNRYFNSSLSIPEFAEELGIARQNLRLLLIGKTWSKLDGPLLKVDYWEDFGRG